MRATEESATLSKGSKNYTRYVHAFKLLASVSSTCIKFHLFIKMTISFLEEKNNNLPNKNYYMKRK